MKKDKLYYYIQKAKLIHCNKYSYEKTNPKTCKDDCIVTCPIHGDFTITLDGHVNRKTGCPKCAKNAKLTNEEFIERAKKKHKNKYDYSKVKYVNFNTEVTIICPIHGEFRQTPKNHLNGNGCNLCKNGCKKLTNEEYIQKANAVHKKKYKYTKLNYKGSDCDIIVTCPIHGDFTINASKHLSGRGCKECENLLGENFKSLMNLHKDFLFSFSNLGFEIYNGAIKYGNKIFCFVPCEKNDTHDLDKIRYTYDYIGIESYFVYEDEWSLKREIVINKIRHICCLSNHSFKIMARKTVIREIDKKLAEPFMNANHIQGFSNSTYYFGAFFNDTLIGVMSFKKESTDGYFELTRFATNNDYICQGIGGKLFKHFIKEKNPICVKSFADRRWTYNEDNNLYTKLNFKKECLVRNDYYYVSYTERIRMHKFGFRKQKINKIYGLPLTMTESEMTNEIGLYRVWNLGLIKYTFKQ